MASEAAASEELTQETAAEVELRQEVLQRLVAWEDQIQDTTPTVAQETRHGPITGETENDRVTRL